MSVLFSPLELRSLRIRNRVFMAPMCQYQARDGLPSQWHMVHLGSRAVGGAGLVMTEAVAVAPEGRISPADCGLWNEAQAEAFRPIARFIREQGAVPALQLAHAGRKASTARPLDGGGPLPPTHPRGWEPVGPSPIAFSAQHAVPRALDALGLEGVVEAFAAAARRALAAGFQVVEIHAAHGYLLHSFLSPLSNARSDDHGGTLENRARLLLRVTDAVRAIWPSELPVFVRLSVTDWVEGGWDLEQSVQLARWLAEREVDLVDCSSGGLVPQAVIPSGPGFQTPFATRIRGEAGIATGAVGLITSPEQAEHIVGTGLADAVLLGRELLRDPYWPLHAARALGADIPWPDSYSRAK